MQTKSSSVAAAVIAAMLIGCAPAQAEEPTKSTTVQAETKSTTPADTTATTKPEAKKATKKESTMTTTSTATINDLIKNDLKTGSGLEATAGKTAVVHYTGWLTDDGKTTGKKFDSSLDRGQPFSFPLGAGHVIQGWDKGVVGMKVGGKRRLVIPSSLGYGSRGAGAAIPPNATLIFDVELIDVK